MSHTKNNHVRRFSMLATSVVAVSMLAACASRNAPLEPLQKARAAVNTAMNDANVVKLAPLELKTATDMLAKADNAWTKDADATEATHLSNLAVQRAQIAQNVAQTRQLDSDIKQAGVDAERARLQGDAANAQAQAEKARAQARLTRLGPQPTGAVQRYARAWTGEEQEGFP